MARALDDLRVLTIATTARNQLIPDAPTMRELGIDVVGGTQRVLAVPKGTPDEIVGTLRDAYSAAMADPEFLAAAEKSSLQLDVVEGAEIDAILHTEETAYRAMWNATPWIQDR
jgi:tripartite-type tricarboxylate transporter receptor subunit TctC